MIDLVLSISKKTKQHPYFDKGSQFAFTIDNQHEISLRKGNVYRFKITSADHPAYITTSESGGIGTPGKASLPNNNGVNSGYLVLDLSGNYYKLLSSYGKPIFIQCARHYYMGLLITLQENASTIAEFGREVNKVLFNNTATFKYAVHDNHGNLVDYELNHGTVRYSTLNALEKMESIATALKEIDSNNVRIKEEYDE
jgi:hypothetical protein